MSIVAMILIGASLINIGICIWWSLGMRNFYKEAREFMENHNL